MVTKQFEVPPKSYNTLELLNLNQQSRSHLVFQLHSFYFNVTLSTEKNFSRSSHKNGTNLGFVVRSNLSSTIFHLWNENFDDVQCMLAVVFYNNSSPIPGGCDLINPIEATLRTEEKDNFLVIETPPAKLSNEMMAQRKVQCGDEGSRQLEYFTYYTYLEQLNFQHDEYFKGIESLLYEGADKIGYKVSEVVKRI